MCWILVVLRHITASCCRRVLSMVALRRRRRMTEMESKSDLEGAPRDEDFWGRVMEQLKHVPPVPKEGEVITHDRIRDALLGVLGVTPPPDRSSK